MSTLAIHREPIPFFNSISTYSPIVQDDKNHDTSSSSKLWQNASSLSEGWQEQVVSEIFKLADECGESDWDGYGGEAVNETSLILASKFVLSLPSNIIPPEVGIEPSGDVEIDWYVKKDHIFSITIADQKIIYGGIYGYEKNYGEIRYIDEVPKKIMQVLQEYFCK